MLGLIRAVLGLGYMGVTLGVSLAAVVALLGFIHPAFDLFNHLQPFLLTGTLLCLLAGKVFTSGPRGRAFVASVAATGFIASAVMVVPDVVTALSPRPSPFEGRPAYKLMTHNIFGLNYDADRVAKAIAQEDPDIIALQEYFPYQRSGLHVMLSVDYPYSAICEGGKRANIAIYSKLPFTAEEDGACVPGADERISRIAAKVAGRDGTPFTIVTTHLDWPAQISKFDDGENFGEGFDLVFDRQRGQFGALAEALTTLPGPLLIAADFNSTSWSYALREFADISGLTRQTHTLLTYPTRFYINGWRDTPAFLPLDHVMTRGGIAVHEVRAGDPAGSDHKSVIAVFSAPAPPI